MATNETEKLQETIDELKERVERLEKENAKLKGKTRWRPGYCEDYYSVDGGKITKYASLSECATDKAVEAGNCFKTESEAEEFLEWLKARKTLLDDTNGFKPDWENGMDKFHVYYDAEDGEFYADVYRYTNNGVGIWFETFDDADRSIKKHEKEWRIYMGLPAKDDDDDK